MQSLEFRTPARNQALVQTRKGPRLDAFLLFDEIHLPCMPTMCLLLCEGVEQSRRGVLFSLAKDIGIATLFREREAKDQTLLALAGFTRTDAFELVVLLCPAAHIEGWFLYGEALCGEWPTFAREGVGLCGGEYVSATDKDQQDGESSPRDTLSGEKPLLR